MLDSSDKKVTCKTPLPSDPVKSYYGSVLQSSSDLRTTACAASQAPPPHIKRALSKIHPEVISRFYGCGSPIPPLLAGLTVLDLGCGTGRDCYVLSQLVGAAGHVIGVDMTDEQLAVAKRHQDWHAQQFGFANVEFRNGQIEDLTALGVADASIDLVISNCVLNLTPNKARVFAEIFRVLKPGGELYFSDIFSDRRIPAALLQDPVLRGECLAGALYMEDFRRMFSAHGCADVRIMASADIAIQDAEVDAKIGFARFTSRTVRAFKLELEDRCEDYGQVATYKGGIPEQNHDFVLDDGHRMEIRKSTLVCGNTADMISGTRYAPYFTVTGDKENHFGLFACSQPEKPNLVTDAVCC